MRSGLFSKGTGQRPRRPKGYTHADREAQHSRRELERHPRAPAVALSNGLLSCSVAGPCQQSQDDLQRQAHCPTIWAL